jgi:hypothetical protein
MERVGRRLSTIAPQYYGLGLTLGWCAKGVDSLARRCNLDGFVWPDGDLDTLGYREVWDANFLASEVASARLSSLIHGVSFMVTTKGRDGEPDVLIHAKDALNATGEWNTRRRALDSLLSITDRDDKGQPTALVLYLPDLTITAANDGGLARHGTARSTPGASRPSLWSTGQGRAGSSGRRESPAPRWVSTRQRSAP